MLSAKVDMRDLTKIRSIAGKAANPGGLMSALGKYMLSSTQRKIKGGIEPQNAPLTRAVKKGGLTLRDKGQYLSQLTMKSDNRSATVGSAAIQGPMIEKGGTIKPKKAAKLYVPAGAKTRQMMRKFGPTPGACIKGMKAAGYSIWKSKSGKALMAALKGAKGKKGEAFVLFILKDRVTVPARRHYFINTDDRKVITEETKNWIRPRS